MKATIERLRHRRDVRIAVDELSTLLTPAMERSMYLHPNPIAREIFWQRLDEVARRVRELPVECRRAGLDLGGGTGVLARAVASYFKRYTIIDLEAADAERVLARFPAPNVTILGADVWNHRPEEPYTTILAADVLEHFQDLEGICRKVNNLLAAGGRLIVSLPTENRLYRIGRVILRKSKPKDHFHDSRTVMAGLEREGLERVAGSWIPALGLPLPLFDVAVFSKPSSQG